MFAVFDAPARRGRAASERRSWRVCGADAAANDAGYFAFSRTVAGISRAKIDGDVSPGIFAAQPAREGRRLERFADGDGGTWPRETQREIDFRRQTYVVRLNSCCSFRAFVTAIRI